MTATAFSSLHLKTPMLKNLASLGYAEMTPRWIMTLAMIALAANCAGILWVLTMAMMQ